jgi:Autophagy-related protein 27
MRLAVLISTLYTVSAASLLNCDNVVNNNLRYDVKSLDATQLANISLTTRKNDLATDHFYIKLGLCTGLTHEKPADAPDYSAEDDCYIGTFACKVVKNEKRDKWEVTDASVLSAAAPQIEFSGEKSLWLLYGSSSGNNTVELRINCKDGVTDSKPVVTMPTTVVPTYNVRIEWNHNAGCGQQAQGQPSVTPSSGSTSIWGWLFFGLVLYFVLGIGFNFYINKMYIQLTQHDIPGDFAALCCMDVDCREDSCIYTLPRNCLAGSRQR